MPTYGPNNFGSHNGQAPGNPSGSTVGWTTLETGSMANGVKCSYMYLTNFGFSIPNPGAGFGVQSVTATLTTTWTAMSIADNSVFLLHDNGSGGSVLFGNEQSAGASWNQTNNYPNTSDSAWGPSTLYSDCNLTGFGIALSGVAGGTSVRNGTVTGATITVAVGLLDLVKAFGPISMAENPAVLAWGRWTISADGSNHFERLSNKFRDWLLGACRELGICREQVRDDFSGFMRHGGGWVPRFVQTRAASFAG